MKFKGFRDIFGTDDFYEDDGTQQDTDYYADEDDTSGASGTTNSSAARPAANKRPNVLSMDGRNASSSKIALYEPRVYSDAKAIVTQMLAGEAVIVNFASIDESQAKRIVDFMMGAAFALEGDVQRIGETIFLVTPHNFEISGSISQSLGQQYS